MEMKEPITIQQQTIITITPHNQNTVYNYCFLFQFHSGTKDIATCYHNPAHCNEHMAYRGSLYAVKVVAYFAVM